MKVAILTEGGSNIGFGHITRCLALYEAFEVEAKNKVKIKIKAGGNKDVKEFLAGKKIEFDYFDWYNNEEILFQIVKGADLVIIDSYLATEQIYRRVKEMGKFLVCIDDYNRLNYNADIVINGSIYGDKIKYDNVNTKYLSGPKYVMLRKVFWDVPKKEINENIKNVLITFGGNDMRNMISRVIELLNKKFYFNLNVVIGKGFKETDYIKKYESDSKIKFYFNLNEKEMRNLMLKADLCISTGGQTTYELAKVGVPTVAICVAENQKLNVEWFSKYGFLESIEWYEDEKLSDKIIEDVKILLPKKERIKRYKIGRNLVNGRGARLVVKEILNETY